MNPRWTAHGRRRARTLAKSDGLDAQALARVVLRDGATLPPVSAEDETAILDLLCTRRDDALAEATQVRNQIRQLLLLLDSEYRLHLPNLQSQAGLRATANYLIPRDNELQQERAKALRRLAERLQLVLRQIDDLTEQLEERAQRRSEVSA